MNEQINKLVEDAKALLTNKTDFQLRKELTACGFAAMFYSRNFYEIGTEEYKELCIAVHNAFSERFKQACEGTKVFKVEIDYKSKSKPTIFGYSGNFEERTAEEVEERMKDKVFTDLNTGRKINPVILKKEITQIN